MLIRFCFAVKKCDVPFSTAKSKIKLAEHSTFEVLTNGGSLTEKEGRTIAQPYYLYCTVLQSCSVYI